MNLPEWLQIELDKTGTRLAAHELTRGEAVTAIRDAIIARNDRALMLGITSEFAGKALNSWHQRTRATGATLPAAQSELFPDLPARLYIRPGVAKSVAQFTAHDWDTARAVLENRTSGAIESAKADWAAFKAAYDKVRPLLSGPLITADVLGETGGPAQATGS